MSVRRPCAFLRCGRPAKIRVYYRTDLKTATESWARVCPNHAVQNAFTWGTIVRWVNL